MFMGSSIYYHPLMVTCYLSYPMWLWECQVHIDGLQMTCIRCAIDILGAQQKQLISIIILDSHLGIHLVLVISSVQIIIVMTTISIGGGGVHCSKWIGSTLILLLSGVRPQLNPYWSVRYTILYMCALFCVMLAYYMSTSTIHLIFMACIHLGVHDHIVSNDTRRESLEMAYQCVVNEVMKIPTAKHSTIVMTTSKQLLANYYS